MLNKIKYILTMLLMIAALWAAGDPFDIDSVCINANRNYRVNGETGSTYEWLLTDSMGNPVTLSNSAGTSFTGTDPLFGATIQGNEINIFWGNPGLFSLTSVQTSTFGCDSIRFGNIRVYDLPLAYAGKDSIICPGITYLLSDATASNYSTLRWSSSGDGLFNDEKLLNPEYTPGPIDLMTGFVSLTLTAEGLGEGSTCIPSVSSVNIQFLRMTADLSKTDISCYGAIDGIIRILNPSGGTGNYEYNLDGNGWTASIEFKNLTAGSHQVQMRDLQYSSCITNLGTIEIIEPDILNGTVDHTDATCLENDGTITVTNPLGGWGNYEYALNDTNWQAGNGFTGLIPASYEVWIRDADYPDCKIKLDTITIAKPLPLSATLTITDVTCFEGNDGTITISEQKNGSGTYQYSTDGITWFNNATISGLISGTYTVQMRDFNEPTCFVTLGDTVINEPERLQANTGFTNVKCYGGNDGTITLTNVTGGSGFYEYSVDGVFWSTSPEFTGLTAQTDPYFVLIRDEKNQNCIAFIDEIIITQPLKLEAQVSSKAITCNGANDGLISVFGAMNGISPYEYSIDSISWNGSSTFIGLKPGTYKVYIRDFNLCTEFINTITLVDPLPLLADITSTNATCLGNDGTITLSNPQNSVSGLYEYNIDGINWTSNEVFDKLAAGKYGVKIRDFANKLCERVLDSITITDPIPLLATAEKTDITCFGAGDGMITIINPTGGSGVYEYSVDSISWELMKPITNLNPGNHKVWMRDANANECIISVGNYIILEPDLLTASGSPTDVTCYDGNDGIIILENATGGSGNYEYSINGVNWVSNQFNNLRAGIYNIQMRDFNQKACIVMLAPIEVKQPPQLAATINKTDVSCFGGSDGSVTISNVLNGTKPYQYSLDGGITWQPDSVFTGKPAGTYDLAIIQDAKSCIANLGPVTILQPTKLGAIAQGFNEIVPDSNDGSIIISAQKGGSGIWEYSLDGINWQTDPTFTGLAPNTYNVEMRDALHIDCKIMMPVIILKAGTITATYTSTPATCFGLNDGTITFTNPSGATDYEYSIFGNAFWQTSGIFTGLYAQTYTLKIRDAANITNETTLGFVNISQPDPLAATILSTSESFPGANDGTFTVSTVTGGSGVYEFSIDNLTWVDTNVFSGLTAGPYQIWIRDKNALYCTLSIPKNIPLAGQLSADIIATSIKCKGDKTGIIAFYNESGALDFDYSIDGGISWRTTKIISGLFAGVYDVMMRDANNTNNVISLGLISITEPLQTLAVDYSGYEPPKCFDGIGEVTIRGFGGTPPYIGEGTYSIPGGKTQIITIIDSNGCKADLLWAMPNPNPITLTATASSGTCFGDPGTVTIKADGGTGIYFVGGKKLDPDSTSVFTVPTGNNYSYRVSDSNGCQSNTITGTVPVPTDKLEIQVSPIEPLCYGNTNATITVSATGGTPPYSGIGEFYRTTGFYTFTVTDANGCNETGSIDISLHDPPAAPTAVITNPDCLTPFGSITVNNPEPGKTYEYSMDGGSYQSSSVFSNLLPGSTHTIRVKDILTGCESDFTTINIGLVPDSYPPPTKIRDLAECETFPIQVLNANDAIVLIPGVTITWYDTPTAGNVVVSPILSSTGNATYYAEASVGICVSTTRTRVNLSLNPYPPAPIWIKDIVECEESPIQTLNANEGIQVPAGAKITWFNALTGGTEIDSPILYAVGEKTYYAESSIGNCPGSPRTPVKLTIIKKPDAPVSQGDILVCENELPIVLDARDAIDATGKNIRWFDKAVGGILVASPTISTVGEIVYYAEDFNGVCSSAPRTPVKLSIAPLPQVPIAAVTVAPNCTDPLGTVEVTNPLGAEYEYGVDSLAYQSARIFDKLISGNHKIRVRNIETGCESDTTIIVPEVPPLPRIIDVSWENCRCYGDTVAIDFEFEQVADGTYVIIYIGGQFENVNVKDNKAQVMAVAGTYNVLAIEIDGCKSNENWNVNITEPDRLSVSGVITEIDLKSNQKGEIDITISGGTKEYNTSWIPNPESGFTGAVTEDIRDLNDGDYSALITDSNGCPVNYLGTIPIANQPPFATDDEFVAKCSAISGDLLFADNGNGVDYDVDGDSIFIDTTPIRDVAHGTLTINADGTFDYQAFPGYSGDDSFLYQIFDVKKNYSAPATVIIHVIADFDCDGHADDKDPDADGDGILNVDEGDPTADSDGDGHPDWLDIDADNDGIVDNVEGQTTPGYTPPMDTDTDNDGINDAYDPDNGGTPIVPIDTDADGIPDFLDVDSDGDGVPDYIEGHDLNADGKIDDGHIILGKDLDADGLDDAWDTANRYQEPIANITGSDAPIQEFFDERNADGILDWRDDNDDNDEYLTRFEDLNIDGNWANDNTDDDGYPEYLDYGRECDLFIPNAFSPNGDDIHDYFQIFCIENFPDAQIYIFDQLGNLLYEKENYGNLNVWRFPPQAWWDGRTKNRAATVNRDGRVIPGTYFYVLKLGNGEVRKSFVFISY